MTARQSSRRRVARDEAGLEELRNYEEWRLDAWWVKNLTRRIFATGTREQLDDLTRHIWRKYAGTPVHARENAKALEQLTTAITCRRAAVGGALPRRTHQSAADV